MNRLLRPKSIAIIGGGAWCEAVVQRCVDGGFDGEIWPVHPKRPSMAGIKTFASLAELPHGPDASFIGVNRHATIDIVRQLSAMDAGGAVCFASGFKETEDGIHLQEQLLMAAGDMPFLGPNCYGFLNMVDGATLWPDVHGAKPVESGVAIITQSSNIAINLTMQQRGLPIAYMVTAGNQANQGVADIARTLLKDNRVTAIGLHIEGFQDIRAYEALAMEAENAGKSIVVLKIGNSTEAQQATISHTASLAGSSVGSDGLMKRLGFRPTGSLSVMLEALKIAHLTSGDIGDGIVSMSCSGGEASLMADTAFLANLSFPAFSETQMDALSKQLSDEVSLTNPLDYHTNIWRNVEAMTEVFGVAASNDAISLAIVVLDFPRLDKCYAPDWDLVIEAVKNAQMSTGKQFCLLASLAENMPESIAEKLIGLNIIPLSGMEDALRAISIMGAKREMYQHSPILLAPHHALPSRQIVLTEAEAKRDLADFGLATPNSSKATSPAETSDIAKAIGFPVVLKGEGISHKTEQNAVILNLPNAIAVADAAAAMACETYLIEEMISDPICELLVGVVRDPAHGFVLTLGAGGTLTELIVGSQSGLLPLSKVDIAEMLSRLPVAKILHGYRGNSAADINAIIDAIFAIQNYAVSNADNLLEVEINPLICTASNAIAADALIVKEEKQ